MLPENVSVLGKDAFSMTNITGTLKLPDSLEVFGGSDFTFWINDNGSFSSTLIERLIIGDNVEIITERASFDCRMLKYVSMGKNIALIGENAFERCPLIETVVCLANEPPTLAETAFRDVDYTHCVVEVRKHRSMLIAMLLVGIDFEASLPIANLISLFQNSNALTKVLPGLLWCVPTDRGK